MAEEDLTKEALLRQLMKAMMERGPIRKKAGARRQEGVKVEEDLRLTYDDMDVIRMGNKIVLPVGMSIEEGIIWLQRKAAEEEQIVGLNREYDTFLHDGAAAMARAIARKYGWAGMKPTPGFFGPTPPAMIHVKLFDGQTIEVPWGRFAIPDIEGWIGAGISRRRNNLPRFMMTGQIKQKDRHKAVELGDLIEEELRERSIYRGNAMRFQFPVSEDEESFDPSIAPEFLEVDKIEPDDLILSRDVMELVDTTLFTPIRHTDRLRAQRIPLKRGVLLEGPYGVGKTLLAYVMAHMASKHGWTYLYANVGQLRQAIEFALIYEPAIVFAEDLDQVLSTTKRDAAVNDILNTIDGVQVKGRDIMVVLTTNHVEKINRAMLRPGRLDTVITIAPPDADAAARLIRLYGRDQIPVNADLTEASLQLAGQIPAVIREVVERSKLSAIARGDTPFLTAEDLAIAARGMVRHLSLLKDKDADTRSDLEKAAAIVAGALNGQDKEGHA